MASAIMIKLPELFRSREARKLEQELNEKLSVIPSPSVLVDFSRVRQMDLEGLEGLLDCMEIVARQDGALELGEISPQAATLLELTRMDSLFRKFPGFDAAPSFTPSEEVRAESQDAVAEMVVQVQPVAA